MFAKTPKNNETFFVDQNTVGQVSEHRKKKNKKGFKTSFKSLGGNLTKQFLLLFPLSKIEIYFFAHSAKILSKVSYLFLKKQL